MTGLARPGRASLRPSSESGGVGAVVERLVRTGINPEDRVVISVANSAPAAQLITAVIHIGCSVAVVDHREVPERKRRLARSVDAGWLLCDHGPELPPRRAGDARVVVLSDAVPSGAQDQGASAPLVAESTVDPWRWLAREDALVLWTSGTTGAPRGVVRSGPSLHANAARTLTRMGYRDSDLLMPLLPFTHQYGFSMLLLWQMVGCRLLVTSARRVDHAVEAIVDHGVTVVDATPSTYEAMVRVLGTRGTRSCALRSVRMWCVGGAPLSRPLRHRFEQMVGAPLLDGYGSSELGNVALADPSGAPGCGPPLEGVDVVVLDESGAQVPPGVLGEIVVTSPDTMTGTLGPLGKVLRGAGGPGIPYRTGDIGHLDADGNLHVQGRRHAVHRLGHTLHPDELAVRASQCGRDVHVLTYEHAVLGARLVFVVVDGSDRPRQYWKQRFREVLAGYERPDQVVVVNRLPTNGNGKTDVAALRALVGGSGSRSRGAVCAPPVPALDPGRLDLVDSVAEVLERRRSDVRAILLEFAHHRSVDAEFEHALGALSGARAEVTRHAPGRVGAGAVFMPSNMLLYGYVLHLAIPSTYVDVIRFRPSRKIHDATARLHRLITAEVELPVRLEALTQREFVHGAVAEADLVMMTGTYNNAEQIRVALRPDQLFLYFGQGVNPIIVGADSDIERCVSDVVRIRTFNSGQDCFGPDQILVHQAVADTFLTRLCDAVDQLRYGANDDLASDYGPLFYDDALDASIDYLRRRADRIVTGGRVSIRDRHLQPTVLDLPLQESHKIPEMFAPIFNVLRYEHDQELTELLGSSYFVERAMGAMVYGSQTTATTLLRRHHTVVENSTLLDHENGNEPFGGNGVMASYVVYAKRRTAEPVLASKAVAEYLGQG